MLLTITNHQSPTTYSTNTKKKVMMFLIILIIFWQCSICFAQLLEVPLGDELYREVYDFIDRMVARQAVTKVFKNILPYSNADVAQALIELEKAVKERHIKLSKIEQSRLDKLLSVFSTKQQTKNSPNHPFTILKNRLFSEYSHQIGRAHV